MFINFFKKYYWLVATLILCVPMLLLNTGDRQHWGDDFAQYLLQAQNLSKGANPYITGFIANPDNTLPPVAPLGFSLMLAPVVAVFGLQSLAPYVMLLSLSFCVFMLLSAIIFRKYLSPLFVAPLLFIAFFPNFMFWMKLLITSDVPFTVGLLLLLLLQLRTQSFTSSFFLGLLFGLLLLTRNVVIVAPAAMLLSILFKYYFNNSSLANLKFWAVQTATGLLLYILVTYVLFPSSVDYPAWAMSHLTLSKIGPIIRDNYFHYYANLISLFSEHGGEMKQLSFGFTAVFVVLFLVGFAKRFLKGDYWAFFTLAYLLLILSVNIISDYRYLIPIHCFLVLFAAEGFQTLVQHKKVQLVIGVAVLVFFISIYKNHIEYLYTIRHHSLPGPTTPAAREAFEFIRNHVKDDEVIVFPKPRALTLFTGKKTTINSWTKQPDESYEQLKALGVNYFLKAYTTTDEGFDLVIAHCSPNLTPVFTNNEFVLYKHTAE